MFKNSKEKSNNYISTEDVEKLYAYQKKSFDGKILEQQKSIDQLTDYISARFGENVANSNLATRLDDIQRKLQEIESTYKANLEKTTKELKKQITDENKKVAVELNDMQTESYFKLLQKNENDLEKIRNAVAENKGNNEKIVEIENVITEHLKDDNLYKQEIQKELKKTNQEIGKINYLGISSKFDKKIREECSKLECKIFETDEQVNKYIAKNIENVSSIVCNLDEKLSKEIELKNEQLDEKLSKEIDLKNEQLDEKLSKEIELKNKQLDEKLSKEIELKNEQLDEKLSKEITLANEQLDEKFSKKMISINKKTDNTAKQLEELEKNIKEDINNITINVENTAKLINDSNENLTSKIEILENEVYNEIDIINKKNDEIDKQVIELKSETKNNNKETEEKIKQINNNIEIIQDTEKNLETKIDSKVSEIEQNVSDMYIKMQDDTNQTIDTKLQDIIVKIESSKDELEKMKSNFNSKIEKSTKSSKNENIKLKETINQQIISNQNETKTELENISLAVDVIKNTIESSYDNIGQEILQLKEETKSNLEKQANNETDIENLKKAYNKYATKMNNELTKISKTILNAQKKNLETNQNLQVKIKAYIDNKIAKADNTQKIEELINNLNLSIKEREKAQRLEMEELLNKKIKAIQKENERILKEKIDEISSKFIKENTSYTRPNPNNVTFYTETPKKKNAYELIDENQILRKSAKNKNPLSTSQEGKSQILKFFYDE